MAQGGVLGTRTVVRAWIPGKNFQVTVWKNDWSGEEDPKLRDFLFIDLGGFFTPSKLAAMAKAIEQVYEGAGSAYTCEFSVTRPTSDGRISFQRANCITVAVAKQGKVPFKDRIQSLIRRMEPLFGRMEMEVVKRNIVALKRDDGSSVYEEVD